jgi:hypothetical protein
MVTISLLHARRYIALIKHQIVVERKILTLERFASRLQRMLKLRVEW